MFVHNSDTTQGYEVSIEEHNKSAYGNSTQHFTRKVSAGSYLELGCTNISSASSRRSWKILGEQPFGTGKISGKIQVQEV